MISVVICSKGNVASVFTDNIRDTIGCAYELIVIDNAAGKYGICEAYNKGARQSIFNLLVFVHEDVIFHSSGWGNTLYQLALDRDIGIIGCAGTVYKSGYPTSWVDVPETYYRTNVTDGWNAEKRQHRHGQSGIAIAAVVVLDGMFLCMRKNVWEQFPFNEKELKGFHLYDLDICLRTGASYSNIVSYDILVEHLSAGNFDQNWFKETIRFHKKWKKHLPKTTIVLTDKEDKNLRYYSLVKCIQHYTSFKMKGKQIVSYILQLFLYKPLSSYNLKLVKGFVKSRFQA